MDESLNIPANVAGIATVLLLVWAFRRHGGTRVSLLIAASLLSSFTRGLVRNGDAPSTATQIRWSIIEMGIDPLTVAIPAVILLGAFLVWMVRIPSRRRQRRQTAALVQDGTMRADRL